MLSLLSVLPLCACLSTGGGPRGVALPQEGVDLFQLVEGEMQSAAGCLFDYRVFVPTTLNTAAVDSLVVIGHGFLRHQDTMSNLARHIANEGHRVSTLEFCNMRPWNGHHVDNGFDMRLLAEHLGANRVIYAGLSAGALAAMLAAAQDPNTVGVITLDLVDHAGLGAAAANSLEVPVMGIAGRSSSCNRMGSAVSVFDNGEKGSVMTLTEASHCEFESPTDGWCEFACGDDDDNTENQTQRSAIIDGVVTRVNVLFSNNQNIPAGRSIVVTPLHQQ